MMIGLTGHKAQDMTIAKDEPFEKVVLHFPTSDTKKVIVGLEYVMTGRTKTLTDFAIGNKVADQDRSKLLKIGTMPKGVERRGFQQMVNEQYKRVDRPRVKAEIAAVHTTKVKAYECGCRFCASGTTRSSGTGRPLIGRKTGRCDRRRCQMSLHFSPSLPFCFG